MNEYRFMNPEDQQYFESEDKLSKLSTELNELLGEDVFSLNPLEFGMLLIQKAPDLNTRNTIGINLLSVALNTELQIRKLKTDLTADPDNLDLQRRLEEKTTMHEQAKLLSKKIHA